MEIAEVSAEVVVCSVPPICALLNVAARFQQRALLDDAALLLKSTSPWWKVFDSGSVTLDEVIFILRAGFGFDGRMLALAHLIDSHVSYSDRIPFARPRKIHHYEGKVFARCLVRNIHIVGFRL